MKLRIFSVLWLVAVKVAKRGIPRSWPDALALLLLVLRAWATSPIAEPSADPAASKNLGPAWPIESTSGANCRAA